MVIIVAMDGSLIIISAALFDLMAGDPAWFPHPVRMIGNAISRGEGILRRFARTAAAERAAGALLTLVIVAGVYGIAWYAISFLRSVSAYLGIAVAIYLSYTTLAIKELSRAAKAVLIPLRSGDIQAARRNLSMIVGRDTGALGEKEIARATVETVAENASDGVIAPLVYLALGGPALAMTYKAVNTLDSMIGHRSERYQHFGWAAAKLDDVANFIPARITAVLICMAAEIVTLMRFSVSHAQSEIRNPKSSSWRIMLRDGAKHPSPNSGWPEAAMAGALGVRLGGASTYNGILSERPYLGDRTRDLEAEDIARAIRFLGIVSLLGVLLAATTRFCAS